MSATRPTLHMFCGKIAAGKSTLATALAAQESTVLISEDRWLNALFGDQMSTGQDYLRCASKLRTALGPHILSLLKAGVSVVLDAPANTVETRAWMRGLLDETETDHQLHVLDASDDLCLARLRHRNALADHPFAVTEEQFHQFTRHYAPPTAEEGFTLIVHNVTG